MVSVTGSRPHPSRRRAVRPAARRRAAAALVVALLAPVLVACGSHGTPDGESTPAATWPLTGMRSSSPHRSRPALVVKIENSVESRPQTGLDAADVVYEELVEGGITRFAAVYQSQLPAEVGPVRSIRPTDVPLTAPFRGLFAYSGGQAPFVAALRRSALQDVGSDEVPAAYRRDTSRVAPHNLYAKPATLVHAADDDREAPAAPFPFAGSAARATARTEGDATKTVGLTISPVAHPSWTWSDGRWLRSESGAPARVASGKRLSAANVVVLRVTVENTSFRDPIGNPVPEARLTGSSGAAVVASDGHTVRGRWTKSADDEHIEVIDRSGERIALAPGRTWVELVPRTGTVTLD